MKLALSSDDSALQLLTEPIEECGQGKLRRKTFKQTLRNFHGEFARASDDRLFRCYSVPDDRRFGLAVEFRDLLRRLREQICLLHLCGLPRLGDQPVPLCPDFCARLIRVGTGIGSFLTGRNRVGQQLVRLFLPLGRRCPRPAERRTGRESR